MTLTDAHEGTEEWCCPVCGYTFLLEWLPWKKVIIKRGDIYARHSASKGMTILGIEIT